MDLWDGLAGVVLLGLFAASLGFGAFARRRLPAQHRTTETAETLQLVMSLLITFAALVLGLLTTSVKSIYDTDEHDRVTYAAELTQLDRCLRNYGPEAAPVRDLLRTYTATVIVSTWPDEPRPGGVATLDPAAMPQTGAVPALAGIMNDIGLGLHRLAPSDALGKAIAADCFDAYKDVLKGRLAVIGDVYSSMSTPFFCAVVAWLAVVFAGLGFRAPLNPAIVAMVGLAMVSVTSALVITYDMNSPYEGPLRIPSRPMRAALEEMGDGPVPMGVPTRP